MRILTPSYISECVNLEIFPKGKAAVLTLRSCPPPKVSYKRTLIRVEDGICCPTPLIEALPGQALWRCAMDLKLKDKVALITGSSRGIGLATAKAFAAEGCCLVLSARSAEPLAAAEAALRADDVAVASCIADVGQPDQAARLVEAATAAFGGIDILVNNVGGGGGGARIADSTDEDWRGALERNLIQTVRMMRLALPHMQGRAGASVINVASISGWAPQLAMSGQYGAAKAALIFDTERWALEFVPHGVRVNPVPPASIPVAGNACAPP